MNWGLRITILYLGFVGLIITMVGLSSREKVDLVSKDYYEQELRFQERLDMSGRSNALSEQLKWEVKKGEVLLEFPSEFEGKLISGSVYFFRPSDAALDKTFPLASTNGSPSLISTSDLQNGVYKMEIAWEAEGEKYYNEGIITVN